MDIREAPLTPIDARHLTPEVVAAKLLELEDRIAAVELRESAIEKREAAVERVIDHVITPEAAA